jgi:16S rRNA (guanine527-N7)-methyltransferase
VSADTDPRAALLDAGWQALGVAPDPAAQARLLFYLDLLQKWSRAYNLSAVRDPMAMVSQHLLDCLAALPALDRQLPPAARVLDVGSGAGLPGAVLATLRPGWRVTCVDAVAKKASFVRQVALELALPNLTAEHARVEQLPPWGADAVTSRAFASLADFCAGTARHLAPGGCWVAMKGRVPEDEIAALPAGVEVFHVEPLQVPGLDAQRCLIWMRPR